MLVSDIMTTRVHRCRTRDTLERAAQLMWDHDCGALPIEDERGHTVGVVTDRDICMAAYTQGKPLGAIPVTVAGSRSVHSVRPDTKVEVAEAVMEMHRIRRLPVIDIGGNLVGMLSLADIVRCAHAQPVHEANDGLGAERIVSTLESVYRPAAP